MNTAVPAPLAGRCQVCSQELAPPVVWCTSCDTAVHQDCFAYNGKCARYGCNSPRYKHAPGRAVAANWIEKKSPEGPLVPQAYVADFDSLREEGLAWAAVLFGLCSPLLALFSPWNPIAVFLGSLTLSGCLALVRLTVNDYYVVDGKTQTVSLHQQILFHKTLTTVEPFANCDHLRLWCRNYSVRSKYQDFDGYKWTLEICFKTGRPVLELANELTKILDPNHPKPPAHLRSIADRIAWISRLRVEIIDRPL